MTLQHIPVTYIERCPRSIRKVLVTIGTQLGKLDTPYNSYHRIIYQQRIARYLFNFTHHANTSIIHLSVKFDLSRNVCFVCIVMREFVLCNRIRLQGMSGRFDCCKFCLHFRARKSLNVLRQLLSGPGNVSTMFARRVGVTGTNEMLSIIATERRQIVTTTAKVALRVRPVCIT